VAGELILVVDDGADMREFVVEYVLKPNDYRWLTAEDGQRGLQMAVAESPDLILLDLQMPRLDGIGMLKAMQERGLGIPVVLMTFHGSEEIAVEVFRMGVVDYVIKPYNVDELLDAMGSALTETRLRHERDQLTQRLVDSNVDLKQRVKELQTLYGIGKSIASLVDVNTLLGRVADAAAYVTNSDDTSVMLLGNGDELFKRVVKSGGDPVQVTSAATTDQNAYATLQAGQPILVETPTENGQITYNALYVPVVLGNRSVGVLRVINQAPLGEHEVQLLNALADYIAIGLKNI
jgi:two-component system NtrC family sensor kinase